MLSLSHKVQAPREPTATSVLVLSRNPAQAQLLGSLLKHHGMEVWTIGEGKAAMDLLCQVGPVNVVVMDWDRSDDSGPEFCEWIHTRQEFSHIPILAVSSKTDKCSLDEWSRWGVTFIKGFPINPQRFLAMVDQMIDKESLTEHVPRVFIGAANPAQWSSFSRGIRELGWSAQMEPIGRETCQILKKFSPDLLLLEYPFSDGVDLDLIDEMRVLFPNMKIFVISDHNDPTWLIEVLHRGIDEIVRFPITAEYIQALWEKSRNSRSDGIGLGTERLPTRNSQDDNTFGRLAGQVAHDINNVLTSILGHAGLLHQRSPTRDFVLRSSLVIEQAARRGKDLTAKLLGSIRPQSERRESINLCDIVQEVLALVQPEEHHAIELERCFSAQDCWIQGDAGKLHQIVLNLIVNACDAMSQGGKLTVEIRKTLIESGEPHAPPSVLPGRYLELIVKDTGPGISAEVLPHIFEVFFTTKTDGSGIGLATVREVAQQHGGTVTVNSQIGKGTTFHVLLRQDTPGRRDVGLRPNGQDFPHVLVVDDDREVGQTAAALLEYLGCHVTVVDQGSSAIALLQAQPHLIDVVILDMAMTPMDGSSCFRMLHALFPTIPVILSSGFDLNIELAPLFDEGLAGFVQKPYDIQDLFSVLEKVKSGGLSRFPGKVAFSAPSTQGIVSPI